MGRLASSSGEPLRAMRSTAREGSLSRVPTGCQMCTAGLRLSFSPSSHSARNPAVTSFCGRSVARVGCTRRTTRRGRARRRCWWDLLPFRSCALDGVQGRGFFIVARLVLHTPACFEGRAARAVAARAVADVRRVTLPFTWIRSPPRRETVIGAEACVLCSARKSHLNITFFNLYYLTEIAPKYTSSYEMLIDQTPSKHPFRNSAYLPLQSV